MSDKVGLDKTELAHWKKNITKAALTYYADCLLIFLDGAKLSEIDDKTLGVDYMPLAILLEGEPKWASHMTIGDIRRMLREMLEEIDRA